MSDPRHRLGHIGEQLALDHLERLGYELVVRNFRTRVGEIDLVVRDGRSLVFVEVKTRRASRRDASTPWDALDHRKRRRVRQMARAYLAEARDRPAADEIRFDAVGVLIDGRGRLVGLDHLEGAF